MLTNILRNAKFLYTVRYYTVANLELHYISKGFIQAFQLSPNGKPLVDLPEPDPQSNISVYPFNASHFPDRQTIVHRPSAQVLNLDYHEEGIKVNMSESESKRLV
jgi:hypothetical protein